MSHRFANVKGSLLFGAIDTMKYTGPLEKLAIIAPASAPDGNLRLVNLILVIVPTDRKVIGSI
jgi:hypothetical protein